MPSLGMTLISGLTGGLDWSDEDDEDDMAGVETGPLPGAARGLSVAPDQPCDTRY